MNDAIEKTADAALVERLHNETAKIKWRELQKFFAQGNVLQVVDECDLLSVAAIIAQDKAEKLEPFLSSGQVAPPSNDQARDWYATEALVWSVVVAPFVLVQSCDSKPETGK